MEQNQEWIGEERRSNGTMQIRMAAVEAAVDGLREDFLSMKEGLEKNTVLTQAIANDTEQLREYWREARSAFRLFNRIAATAKWFIKYLLLPVVGIFAALYAWTHDGQPPAWVHSLMKIVE